MMIKGKMAKNTWVLLALLLGIFNMHITFAGELVTEYEIHKAYTNCVFKCSWENEEQTAVLEVTSPDGQVYGTNTTPERASVSPGRILLNVGKTPVGTWQIRVEGQDLGQIDVTGGEIPDSMTFKSLDITKNEDAYTVHWDVQTSKKNLSYKVYADSNDVGYDGELVASFNESATGSKTFNLDRLDTGHYFIYMKAYEPSGTFTYEYAKESVYHLKAGSENALSNVKARLLNDDVYLTWDKDRSNTYKIMLFDPESKKCIFEAETSDYSYLAAMPENYDTVLAAVASYKYDRLGDYELIEVSKNNKPNANVIFQEGNATNTDEMPVDIQMDNAYTVIGLINDKKVLEEKGFNGSLFLPLENGDNTVVLMVKDEEDNMVTFLKNMYMDKTPPMLTIMEDVHERHVKEPIVYIDGEFEAGATITCNEQAVETVGRVFSIPYELKSGENLIQINAKDIAGNISSYSAVVYYDINYKKYLKIGLLVGIPLILIVIYIYTIRKQMKRGKNDGKDSEKEQEDEIRTDEK